MLNLAVHPLTMISRIEIIPGHNYVRVVFTRRAEGTSQTKICDFQDTIGVYQQIIWLYVLKNLGYDISMLSNFKVD